MRTPFGRVAKPSIALIGILVLAVVAGLIAPGSTGDVIEIVAWGAIVVLILLEVGTRTTPMFGNYYGDERNERERQEAHDEDPIDPNGPNGVRIGSREV